MKTMYLLMMTGAALVLAPLANAQNRPSHIWNGGSIMTDLSAPRAIGIHVLRINDSDETAKYSNTDTPGGKDGRNQRHGSRRHKWPEDYFAYLR